MAYFFLRFPVPFGLFVPFGVLISFFLFFPVRPDPPGEERDFKFTSWRRHSRVIATRRFRTLKSTRNLLLGQLAARRSSIQPVGLRLLLHLSSFLKSFGKQSMHCPLRTSRSKCSFELHAAVEFHCFHASCTSYLAFGTEALRNCEH